PIRLKADPTYALAVPPIRLKADATYICVILLTAIFAPAFFAQEYKPNLPADHPAIQYAQRPVHDAAAALARKLDAGTITLSRRGVLGYLPDLLEQLHIGADSQMLVFSKTSFQ